MKITFRQFIKENSTKKATTSPLSLEEAATIVKTHCKVAMTSESGIYRGITGLEEIDSGFSDSKDESVTPRKSSMLRDNFYTIWLDNHPAWKHFPKRSRSFICTNDPRMAITYGRIFRVFPYDNCHVGMTASNDIWYSFKREDGGGIDDLAVFQTTLGIVIRKVMGVENVGDYNYNQLRELFSEISIDMIDDELKHPDPQMTNNLKIIKKVMVDNGVHNILQLFEVVLQPDGFEMADSMKGADLFIDIPEAREIYISGKAIFVAEDKMEEFKRLLNGD